MRFRWHRGGLAASLRTTVEFADARELVELVRSVFDEGEITVEHYGYDGRCDWDLFIVSAGGVPVGYTDGPVVLEAK